MARKKELTVEELNWIMEQMVAVADEPIPEMIFTADVLGVDFEDMPPASNTAAPTAATKTAASLPPVSGTRPILIRVPERVVRAFKIEAERTRGHYQTLMNRFLKAAADGFV